MTDPNDPPMAGPGTEPGFTPSHVVPRDGMATWSAPDMARPSVPLDPLLPVQLVDRRGDWAHVLCSNGWAAWVDGRLLVSIPQSPPAAGQPLARTADPRPLLDRLEREVRRYRQATEELAAGADGEAFRQRTRGLRFGVVVDGEAVWLYDAQHERWCYSDGGALKTYAASHTPSSTPTPPGAEGPSETSSTPTPPGAEDPSAPPSAPSAPSAAAASGPEGRVAPEAPPPTQVIDQPEAEQPPPAAPPPTDTPAQPQPPPPTQVMDQPADQPEAEQPGVDDPAGTGRGVDDDGQGPRGGTHPPTRFGDVR
ncbi:hypothetical protein [Streptomyces sp. NPDC051776]|uniref:hypothetical protein n=1 Tax=Streptomyces sp. NPDC051776 TaxID=3155414 RepID=UPI0034144BC4